MDKRVYQREKLYQEVWAEPLLKVSKRYEVSDVALNKICKRLNIPLPGRGYWARLKAGQKMKVTPLGKHTGITEITVPVYEIERQVITHKYDLLEFLDETKRTEVFTYCDSLKVPMELDRLHPMIKATKQNARSRQESTLPPVNQVLNFRITDGTRDRAFLFIDCLFKALEHFEYSIENRTPNGSRYHNYKPEVRDNVTYVKKGSDSISIMVKERMRQVTHVPTPEEIANKRKYPNSTYVKAKDLLYSEELAFFIGEVSYPTKTWSDSKTYKIEDKIGEIVLNIMEAINNAMKNRISSEIAAKERTERERLLEIHQKRQRDEVEHVKQLLVDATNYHYSQIVYEYIQAMESLGDKGTNSMHTYLAWAKEKANWINPITEKKDELLGQLEVGIKQFLADDRQFQRGW